MSIVIRPALPDDVESATALLYSAGEQLLCSIFGNGDKTIAQDFLAFAWSQKYGQYGSDNHWVACKDAQVIGLITCWHDQLPDDFDHQTLMTITEYFGVSEALDVVARSMHVAESLRTPTHIELGIGHVAVDAAHRRTGVATALIEEMKREALSKRKKMLILDVETCNHAAIAFYRQLGFKEKGEQPPFLHMYQAL